MNIYIDIEPEAFAASRRHEFEFQISDYKWTYHTRIDYCLKDLTGQLEQLKNMHQTTRKCCVWGTRTISDMRFTLDIKVTAGGSVKQQATGP